MRAQNKVHSYNRSNILHKGVTLAFTLILSEADFDALPAETRSIISLGEVREARADFKFGF